MSEPEKKKRKPPVFKDPLRQIKLDFIGRVTNIPESAFEKRTFWPRELKIANELFLKYSPDFWSKVSFDYKMKSIAFLKGERGEKELEKKWTEFNFVPTTSTAITYETAKVGEDIQVKRIPTLLDFLKGKR